MTRRLVIPPEIVADVQVIHAWWRAASSSGFNSSETLSITRQTWSCIPRCCAFCRFRPSECDLVTLGREKASLIQEPIDLLHECSLVVLTTCDPKWPRPARHLERLPERTQRCLGRRELPAIVLHEAIEFLQGLAEALLGGFGRRGAFAQPRDRICDEPSGIVLDRAKSSPVHRGDDDLRRARYRRLRSALGDRERGQEREQNQVNTHDQADQSMISGRPRGHNRPRSPTFRRRGGGIRSLQGTPRTLCRQPVLPSQR